jgi:putative endonuclease
MAESHNLGRKGEDISVELLKQAGHKILYRNWKWGKHEIDIISEHEDYIIFTEVKTRSENFHMDPLSAVTVEKQKSIILAADGYLNRYNIKKESRFDVITVISHGKSYSTNHIKDAFYPTLR